MHQHIHWQSTYETGHARIDFEHRVFLDLLAEFAAQVEAEADPGRLHRTATEIYKYADFHFYSEENIMLDVRYPEYDHHHALHQALLRELWTFIESIAVDGLRGDGMVEFLVRWFASHTVGEDLKLAVYVAGT